jgi:membrane-associated phospholipid phosphatase
VATLALIVVFAITFAASRHGAALAVTAADDRVVRWFAELRGPWLPRWGRWLVVAAVAAVFLARMYVGAHLPLDMVGGAALGLGIGVAARLLLGTRSAG